MADVRSIDMLLVNELFQTDPGYILNFSNSTFAVFFSELRIDIYDPAYAEDGDSKGKRFRCFLRKADNAAAVRVLKALWEYRGEWMARSNREEKIHNAHERFLALINRLEGKAGSASDGVVRPSLDRAKFAELKTDLLGLVALSPQSRGYEFEKYLQRIFTAFGLTPRSPFKLIGEQIDGSFDLNHETYLVEAKWQNERSSVAALHAFHGKIEQKAAFSRGLFVSYSGFTEDGLVAFGRGKRIICVDGFDLSEALDRELPLNTVLERKVRHVAETGNCFGRVRDLF